MKRKRQRSQSENMTGNMVKMGVGNLVGVTMIGATAGVVNTLPAGTAKSVAGIVPGLQSVALMNENVKAMGIKGPRRMKKKKGSLY